MATDTASFYQNLSRVSSRSKKWKSLTKTSRKKRKKLQDCRPRLEKTDFAQKVKEGKDLYRDWKEGNKERKSITKNTAVDLTHDNVMNECDFECFSFLFFHSFHPTIIYYSCTEGPILGVEMREEEKWILRKKRWSQFESKQSRLGFIAFSGTQKWKMSHKHEECMSHKENHLNGCSMDP